MRAELGGAWQLPRDLTLNGSYRWEGPVGAFLTSGDATLGWQATDRLGVALSAVAFEQAEEFRIGSGRVFGGGAMVDYEARDAVRISGGSTCTATPSRTAPARWTGRRRGMDGTGTRIRPGPRHQQAGGPMTRRGRIALAACSSPSRVRRHCSRGASGRMDFRTTSTAACFRSASGATRGFRPATSRSSTRIRRRARAATTASASAWSTGRRRRDG
jgi:hypothetical protein